MTEQKFFSTISLCTLTEDFQCLVVHMLLYRVFKYKGNEKYYVYKSIMGLKTFSTQNTASVNPQQPGEAE